MAEEPEAESESGFLDVSHDLDMVPVFSSSNHDAEMEAIAVNSILQANDIPSLMVGPSVLPVFEFQVQVPKIDLEDARRVLDEAREAGPAAADAAEAGSEQP
jgi:hypothetical protein